MNYRRLFPSKSARRNRPTSNRTFFRVPAALALSLFAVNQYASAQNTEYDVISSQTNLTAASTYTTGGMAGTGAGGMTTTAPPSVTSDVTFDSGVAYGNPTMFVIPTNVTFGSLNDLNATAITISNTGGAAASTLTLGGTGNLGDSVPGFAAGDLLFVATGANLTINTGAAGTATALGLVLGQSGNFNVAGTAAISSVISGNFGFTKTGAGTLTLSGVNTYTGPTSVTGGTLAIAADSSLGTVPTTATANQLTLNGGILLATASNVVLAANRGVVLGAGGGTFSNSGSTSGGAIQGIISGPGSLSAINIGGARTLTLSGVNTFQGGVIVTGASQVVATTSNLALGTGTVQLGTANNAGAAQLSIFTTSGLNIANAVTVTPGGARVLAGNVAVAQYSGPITLQGGTVNPTLRLAQSNGNSTVTFSGGITGTGDVAFAGGVASRTGANIIISGATVNNVGTISNLNSVTSGVNTISASIGSNVTGVIQNTTGASLVLSGANTYTSPTTVTAGTLLYNGSVGTTATPGGAVSVATTGRLGGNGMLTVASATVDSGGTLAPGATTGATTGALTLNTTSGLTLNGTLAIGITATGSTLLTTTGGLALGANSTLTVTGTSGAALYDLANYTGTLTGTFATLTIPTGYTVNYAGTDFGGTSIELTAVPEPATYVGLLLLAGAGWTYRRRLQAVRS